MQAQDSVPAAAADADADALPVSLELVSTKLSAKDIESALANELRVPVRVSEVPAQKGLAIAVKWRRVTVRFTSESGETTSRSLDLPADGPRSLEIIALLAGNLARDEASELLARLAPPEPPAEEAPAETKTEPAEAPKAEQPKPKEPEKKPEPKKAEPKKAEPKQDALIRDDNASLNLSLYHPTTILSHTERRVLNVEGGLAYSRVGAIEGGALTLGYLRVDQHMAGFSTTVGWNRVDGEAMGVMFSAIGTEGHGLLRGFESAGVLSLRWGNVDGVQASGVVVRADDVEGFQAAAVGAWARDVRGMQASVITLARDVTGFQASVVGVAHDVQGAQASVVAVGHDVNTQLAVVNVAKRADLQIGVVNVADRVDGAAIGVVSIAGNGRVQPFVTEGYFGPDPSVNTGVRFVVGYGYSQLNVGYDHDQSHFRAEGGGGVRFEGTRDLPLSLDGIALEVGGHYSNLFTGENDFEGPEIGRMHYRAGLHVMFFKPLWLMGGVDVSHLVPVEGEPSVGGWAGLALF